MAGFDIREMMNDIDEAPGKVWFWDLEKAVIDADRCVQCGVCVAACPTDSIGIGEDDLPKLVKMCTGCSLCWDFCPRGGLQYEATWKLDPAHVNGSNGSGAEHDFKITGNGRPIDGIGRVHESFSARVDPMIEGAQDGGVVSALLISLLEAGGIDGALLARESESEPWKGGAYLATTIEGIQAMQARPWTWGSSRVEAITLTIALLCTKSFNYEKLMLEEVRDKRSVDLDEVGRVDVIRGKLIVQDKAGETIFEEPIRDFHGAALKGCDECADFMGHAADISVGSVGSADGYSSVLIRSEEGLAAFSYVREKLLTRSLDKPQALDKLDALDKRVAFGSLKRAFDPDAPLFIDYEEHLSNYAGTDRAPVEHEAVRY